MEDVEQHKLWTKAFIVYFMSTLFMTLTFYTLMTTMAMYAMQQFMASESTAGLAASLFVIGASLARLIAGQSVEKVGRGKMMYSSLIIFFVATVAYFMVDNIWLLFIIRFIHGAAFGFANTAINTAVMNALPAERRGEGTGYFSLGPTISTAIGPFLGVYLMMNYDFDAILIAATICAFFATVLVFFIQVEEAPLTAAERQAIRLGFKFDDLFQKDALPISIITLFMGIAYSSVMSFINLYAIEINVAQAASYFFLVYAVVLLVARPLAGKLLDTKGDNFIMYPSIIMFALFLIVLSVTNSAVMLLASAVLLALGYGTYMSSAQAIAAKVAPPKQIGLAMSTYFIGLDFGIGIGPFLLGYLIETMSYQAMYAILGGMTLLLIIAYYMVHGRYAKGI